jgi:hypothetical protein
MGQTWVRHGSDIGQIYRSDIGAQIMTSIPHTYFQIGRWLCVCCVLVVLLR